MPQQERKRKTAIPLVAGGGAWRALAAPQPSASPLPSPASGIAQSGAFGPSPAAGYVWCGKTRTNLPSLERDAEAEIPLQVPHPLSFVSPPLFFGAMMPGV